MSDADERSRCAVPGLEGTPTYPWALTVNSVTDLVKLVARPYVLPVVFVPGIMGSNLRSKATKAPVWRLDASWFSDSVPSVSWIRKMANASPGQRQAMLHPDRCEVDPDGAVPDGLGNVGDKAALSKRGWGEIGETSYQSVLVWLEQHLNGGPANPALWSDFFQDEATIGAMPKPGGKPKLTPGIKMGIEGQPFSAEKAFEPLKTDDLLARARFYMPVYAFGYNWLDSCAEAGERLATRIDEVIALYNNGPFWCKQVILVTHSMGGLVARHCATQVGGAADKIAGIIHGVMPTNGAAVAYRRCKVGMKDESVTAGWVIGSNGQEVTAVFAQAPGALQLLPNTLYPADWLQLQCPSLGNRILSAADPYATVYQNPDNWWGLVRKAWLSPTGGQPISWANFKDNVKTAKSFHQAIQRKYHPTTYVFYGTAKKDAEPTSFEKVVWRMEKGLPPDDKPSPGIDEVMAMRADQVRHEGDATVRVGGSLEWMTTMDPMGYGGATSYETCYWEVRCQGRDGAGDGTVPAVSGCAPRSEDGGHVKQQFGLTGIEHEPAFKKSDAARKATLYAILRISATAKKPT
jgi:pimeloyl-ACP methyl ester carboxylesterase